MVPHSFERGNVTIAGADDPAEVPRLVEEEKPHLVLLDLALPGTDGIELMNDIRRMSDVPVIFLSVYGEDETVARAFDMGAADYVVKPFSPTELAARIRAALRRRLESFQGEPSGPYAAAGLSIDYARRRVAVDGKPVGESWLIRDVVKRVRRKLGETAADARFIFTEPRVGYRMAVGRSPEREEG